MSGCASAEPFALQVLGNSMAPEFSEGCVVIVDPGGPLCHGAFVVAEHGDGVILRQLNIDEGQWSLSALASGHPASGLQALRSSGALSPSGQGGGERSVRTIFRNLGRRLSLAA